VSVPALRDCKSEGGTLSFLPTSEYSCWCETAALHKDAACI
jgi:hypothetical protein